MTIEITSRSNPRLLDLLKRREEHYFFEGEKLVQDLLRRRFRPDLLIVDSAAATAFPLDAASETWRVSAAVMAKLSGLKHPPPVIAVVAELPEAIDFSTQSVVFGLDNVQDPGNMGSIFRCAAAFGIGALALSGACVRPRNPKVLRAAQTALLDVCFQHFSDARTLIRRAAAAGLQIYGSAAQPRVAAVAAHELHRPCLVMLGGEGQGLGEDLLAEFPVIRIAQESCLDSLNVAIVACILMHELHKTRVE